MYYGLYRIKEGAFWETAEGTTDNDIKTALIAKAQYFSDYEASGAASVHNYMDDPVSYFKEQGIEVVPLDSELFLFINFMLSTGSGRVLVRKSDIETKLKSLDKKTTEQFIKINAKLLEERNGER